MKRRAKDKLARKKAGPKARKKRAAWKPATGSGVCRNLPDCPSCGHPACEHEAKEHHAMRGCDGYEYPEGWGICARPRCGLDSTEHGKDEPHPMPYSACTEFEFARGITYAAFVGGGGRFGGGGATGGW